MSVLGLMDSRIDVYSIDDGGANPANPTNRLGEPGDESGQSPTLKENSIRASIQMPRLRAQDDGSGERSRGSATLFFEKRSKLAIGDVVKVTTGPMVETWWIIDGIPFAPSRTSHKEAPIRSYLGKRP